MKILHTHTYTHTHTHTPEADIARNFDFILIIDTQVADGAAGVQLHLCRRVREQRDQRRNSAFYCHFHVVAFTNLCVCVCA
jgi:hypothetical protein